MILLCNRLIHSLNSNIYYEPTIKHICAYSSVEMINNIGVSEIKLQSQSLYNIFKSADDGYMIDIKGSESFKKNERRITYKSQNRLANNRLQLQKRK